jgi:hypothetical protein
VMHQDWFFVALCVCENMNIKSFFGIWPSVDIPGFCSVEVPSKC